MSEAVIEEKFALTSQARKAAISVAANITEGFKNKVSPKVIGSIYNLEFIPYNVNTAKGIKCSITLEELNELFTAVT